MLSEPDIYEGTLYVVATPMGNLEDITLRALRILKEVDLIAAEDTRHTRGLLNYYNIHTPLTSCFAHNEARKGSHLIERIKKGAQIALVSDAGTPSISDPGCRFLKLAWKENIKVVPIPGPSALTTLLSVSGLSMGAFLFEGFLPPKIKRRRDKLLEIKQEHRAVICFESPHRLLKSLGDMQDILGQRQILIGRELTKKFEELLKGTPEEIKEIFTLRKPRGEFTIIISAIDKKKRLSGFSKPDSWQCG